MPAEWPLRGDGPPATPPPPAQNLGSTEGKSWAFAKGSRLLLQVQNKAQPEPQDISA